MDERNRLPQMIHLWVCVCVWGKQILTALKYLKTLSPNMVEAYVQIATYKAFKAASNIFFHDCTMILLIIFLKMLGLFYLTIVYIPKILNVKWSKTTNAWTRECLAFLAMLAAWLYRWQCWSVGRSALHCGANYWMDNNNNKFIHIAYIKNRRPILLHKKQRKQKS